MSVLIDECVNINFAHYLRKNGIEDILCIPGNKELCGLKDDVIERICIEQDRILVTCDKKFYKWFKGLKLLYNGNWHTMLSLINYYIKEEYLYENVVNISYVFKLLY